RSGIEARVQVPDLAGADLDAIVVKFLAETKARRVSLVEPDRHDRAPPPHHADRVAERRRIGAALEHDRYSLRAEVVLELRRNVSIGADRLESDGTGDLQARGQPIDRVDGRRSGRFRRLPDQETHRGATDNA